MLSRSLAERHKARRSRSPKFRQWVETAGAKPTPAQSAWIRVALDDESPASLPPEERRAARELFGDIESVPVSARRDVALLKGARVGGTLFSALYLLYRALEADLSGLAPGEMGFAPIVAPDKKTAAQALRYCSGAAQLVGAKVIADNTEALTIERPDGRAASIECLAASRGGSAIRGRTMVAALMDECAFFRTADTGVVNDLEIYRAITPRIVRGGKTLLTSTAWTSSGLLWDLTKENHGRPKRCISAIAPTLLMRPDDVMREIVEAERARDPDNAAREYDCLPLPAGTGVFFDPAALDRCVDDSLELPLLKRDGALVAAAADLAFRRDSSALAVVHRWDDDYVLAELAELRPEPDAPLSPSDTVAAFAERAMAHGTQELVADGHYAESVREYLDTFAVRLVPAPTGVAGKAAAYVRARVLVNEGHVRLPRVPRLLRQLEEIVARPLPAGGLSIVLPRWSQGGHGDLAEAVVMALARAASLPWEPPVERFRPGSAEWAAREEERMVRQIQEQAKAGRAGGRWWR